MLARLHFWILPNKSSPAQTTSFKYKIKTIGNNHSQQKEATFQISFINSNAKNQMGPNSTLPNARIFKSNQLTNLPLGVHPETFILIWNNKSKSCIPKKPN